MPQKSNSFRDALHSLRDKAASEVLSILSDKTKSGSERAAAVCTILRLQLAADDKLKVLVSALQDTDEVAYWAAIELGRLGDVRAIPHLRAIAREHRLVSIRGEALRSLGNLGDDWIVPHCADLLRATEENDRSLAFAALSALGTTEAITILQNELQARKTRSEQVMIALLLAHHGIDVAEDFLSKELARAENELEQLMIAAALSNYDNWEGLTTLRSLVERWNPQEFFKVEYLVHRYCGVVLQSDKDAKQQVLEWIQNRVGSGE